MEHTQFDLCGIWLLYINTYGSFQNAMLQGFLDTIVISFITPNVSKVMCEASNFVIMKSAFSLMKSPFFCQWEIFGIQYMEVRKRTK